MTVVLEIKVTVDEKLAFMPFTSPIRSADANQLIKEYKELSYKTKLMIWWSVFSPTLNYDYKLWVVT